jgi:hypothetical protein
MDVSLLGLPGVTLGLPGVTPPLPPPHPAAAAANKKATIAHRSGTLIPNRAYASVNNGPTPNPLRGSFRNAGPAEQDLANPPGRGQDRPR